MKNMKIRAITLLIIAYLFPVSVYSWQAVDRDSTYRPVIKEGTTGMSCYFAYPQGGWQIQKSYGNNAFELDKLDRFIHSTFADTLIEVRKITLTGYCSIEGSYAINEELAHDRVNGFRNYLNFHYGLAMRYPVEVRYVGEDWDKLRELVDASTLPEREEVLRIIDQTDIFKGREKKLMDLNGGHSYRRMRDELFPWLRRVEIVVEYDRQPIVEKCPIAAQGGEEQKHAEEVQPTEEHSLREKPRCEARRKRTLPGPLLAVKTNLYSWAGLTSDFEYTAFTPNLSAEVFFAHRWSAVVTATYADRDYDGDKQHWGVSGYSIEPRFWLKGDGRYRGLYVGVYGQLGDFDNRSTDVGRVAAGNANCTGAYWKCGLSVGCYLPLNARWGVELGVWGGYRSADVNAYEVEGADCYFIRNFHDNHFGLVGVNISISYRLGKCK